MKKRTLLVVIYFAFISSFCFSQIKAEQESQPFIEVTGIAEKEVIPDEIYLKIILVEKYSGREKITLEMQEEKLRNSLIEISINLNNLSLQDADADYIKVSWTKKDVIAKKEYSLKVTDANTVSRVLQQLDNLDITGATISKVSYSKVDSLKREVRILAIKAAKEKADYLLMTIGAKTGKPLVIQEKDYNTVFQSEVSNMRGSRSNGTVYYIDGIRMSGQEEDQVLQFQKIKIQSAIFAKFEIQQ